MNYFLVKITLDWIRINSNVLEEQGFVKRPQIWPALCKLINEIGPLLKSFAYDKCGFLFKKLKFTFKNKINGTINNFNLFFQIKM